MPTIINADTASGGAIITGDGSGQLQLQSGGVTALTATGANVTVAGTFTATGGVTGVNLTTSVTGILPVANGGTGAATLTANNVLLGNGTSALQAVAPGSSGNVLTSNGTTWASSTPVSGVQQFTSSGSITAGQAVSLNSDGTVSTTTGVSTAEAALGDTVIDSNAIPTGCIGSFYDPNNDWTLYAGNLPYANYFRVGAFRVNSAGVVSAYGGVMNLQVAATNQTMPVRLIRTGTNRYAVMYATSTSYKNMGLFSINASTGVLTNIASVYFSSSQSSTINYDIDYEPISDRIIVVHRSAGGTVAIEAINPATGASTANTSFSATNGSGEVTAVACKTTGGQFLLAFSDAYTGGVYFRTATINSAGTAITFVAYTSGSYTTSMAAMAYAPSIDRYIFILSPSSGQLSMIMFSTSITQITSSNIGFTSGSATTQPQKSMVNDTLQVFQAITSTQSGSVSALQYGQRSYTASGFGGQSLSGGFPSTFAIYKGSFSPTGTAGIYTYFAPDSGGTNTRAVTFRSFLFSSNAQNFTGFATNTVTTGQNTIVAVPGGVAANQTSLTRNTEYYLNFDGSLVTTATPFGVVLRATSTTGGEVIRPVSARRPVALISFSSVTGVQIPLGATGFRSIECYYSISLSSSNNPIISFSTTSGSATPTTTGLYSTGSTTISNTSWGTLSPSSAFSFTGFYAVDSSVAGGVSQGNYGGLHYSGNTSTVGNPVTTINLSIPVAATGTIMVYGIPA